jgi:hypothetical protein
MSPTLAPPSIDKTKLIESLLCIDNKAGLVVPFKFNKGQAWFNRNKSNRNIILKHRQGGWSSSILADMFTDCIIYPHAQCAVVSHETRSTQRLLDRVQFYYDTMPPPKPKLGAESRTEKTFPDLHSSIYIGTAGSRAFGRGDTIRKALLSELAFYEDARTILNAVEDAVPLAGELTIECTPNGEDNTFYEEWTRAREGKSPYKPFFFPWWWTEDYQIPIGGEIALQEDRGHLKFTTEEEDLIRRFQLTEDQIRWRRWKIAEKQGLFWQEYPEDELSCFITIGNPVFDTNVLMGLAQGCYEGEKHKGGWTFWKAPEQGMLYTIGVDTSAGAPDGSFSGVTVLNSRWEVCATFQSRIDPYLLAKMLKEIGHWYNNAQLAVERNFTGYTVLSHLQDYGNIYYQHDITTGKVTNQKGWWTSEPTKQFMITATKEVLDKLKIWDMNLVRQLRGYRYIKFIATPQTFDDLAISLMIAVAAQKIKGVARGYQGAVAGWSW